MSARDQLLHLGRSGGDNSAKIPFAVVPVRAGAGEKVGKVGARLILHPNPAPASRLSRIRWREAARVRSARRPRGGLGPGNEKKVTPAGVTFPVELKKGVNGSLLYYVTAPDGMSIKLVQC